MVIVSICGRMISPAVSSVSIAHTLSDHKYAHSVWGHIWDQSNYYWVDSNNWATGVGWASAGMVRVLAHMSKSSISSSFVGRQYDLAGYVFLVSVDLRADLNYSWIKETLEASWSRAVRLFSMKFKHP